MRNRGFAAAVVCASLAMCALTACTRAQTAQGSVAVAPAIFFTDILSGPSSGGQENAGAFVTLYGVGFGAMRGSSTVTVGGGAVRSYPVWSDARITVQLGPQVHSGDVTLHLGAVPVVAPQPFTVRVGRILFVGPQGSDGANGSFARPWKTLVHAKDALKAGDILYVENGVTQDALDRYDAALSIVSSGKEGAPIAMLAYPGAQPVIGSATGPRIAMRTPNVDRKSDHWVVAGFRFVGNMQALDLTWSEDWRIVANEFTCPKGFGPDGCVETAVVKRVAFLGNYVHDISEPRTGKSYHAVYFSTDSSEIDVGWNTIARVRACRAVQFHSSPIDARTGLNQYSLDVHDNVIHDVVCDAVNFATVDPSRGPVRARNNLIFHVGTGPDPQDGSADYSCVYVQGGANRGPPGSGTVDVSHNTMYGCGDRGNTDSGLLALSAGSTAQHVALRDNILVSDGSVPFLTEHSTAAPLVAERNLVWGDISAHMPDAVAREARVVNPHFRNPSAEDFAVPPDSAAFGMGAPVEQLSEFVCGMWPAGLARCRVDAAVVSGQHDAR